LYLIPSPSSTREADRFLAVFKSGDSELFEWEADSERIVWIESDKSREHDCPLTGCDYSNIL
jgi:hypothetical protein